ncbi:MAG TPA: hypothetical protein VJY35_04310 [Candidatus Eisenbacteria bacterium]|nr:hypothetical protein [Candidatus Eisenbacteria bacterium]
MSDDRLEQLMKGYQLPGVSSELDRRVMREGAAILERARVRAGMEEVGRDVLHRLGFGWLTWAFDFITTTDAEYRVELI